MLAKVIRSCVPRQYRPLRYINDLAYSRCAGKVNAGPFAGMPYLRASFCSSYVPKVLGIYERELYPLVELAIAANYPLIVDVGAAEGYYAVGMATRCPNARIVAYEMEPEAQQMLRDLTRLNSVESRVEIRGKCEPGDLAGLLAGADRSLVIMDCEGFESELLSLDAVPELRRSSILVEMHDFLVPGVTDKILSRFRDSHSIQRIDQTDRSRADFPYNTLYLSCLPRFYLDKAISEWRPVRMHWLWMTPK